VTALVALVVALLLMLVELRISRAHERVLRARGAIAPADPAYEAMRWGYPGAFIVMAIEGGVFGPAPRLAVAVGVTVFVLAKLLKAWAIRTLGVRWTFRVLVLPGAPLVTAGPYRLLRHPNYVAVIGELVGMAILAGARASGPVAVAWFGFLLTRRIAAEERALGLR